MTDVRGDRIVRIIEDPDIGGDLLLGALAIAAKYDFGLNYGGTLNRLGALLWPDRTKQQQLCSAKDAFRSDIRTYQPPELDRACTAPMLKRDDRCGRNASMYGYITDWATGEQIPVGGCSRHRAWFQRLSQANWAAKPEDPPLPYANHGGALRKHFPLVNWPAFWRQLDPRWVEHPERELWPKPVLQLVLGDGETENNGKPQPLLAAVPSQEAPA